MAERLRRKIRNLLGSARAGSSPAVVVIFPIKFFIFLEYPFPKNKPLLNLSVIDHKTGIESSNN